MQSIDDTSASQLSLSQCSISSSSACNLSQSSVASTGGTSRPFKQHEICDEHFQREEVIGRGSYGTVYLATHTPSGREFALKEISRFQVDVRQLHETIKSEVNVHRKLRHPNIVRLYSYYVTEEAVVLIMEYCSGGTLMDHVRSKPGSVVSEAECAKITRQIGKALYYMHSENVVHRDLKLENILLGSKGDVRLGDFGWSKVGQSVRNTCCGTLDYLPPEMVQRQECTSAVDVWSLGVMIYELINGSPPFFDPDHHTTMRNIVSGELHFPPEFSSSLRHLLKGMLRREPARRPSMRDVLQHPWCMQASTTAVRAKAAKVITEAQQVHVARSTQNNAGKPSSSAVRAPPASGVLGHRSPNVAVAKGHARKDHVDPTTSLHASHAGPSHGAPRRLF